MHGSVRAPPDPLPLATHAADMALLLARVPRVCSTMGLPMDPLTATTQADSPEPNEAMPDGPEAEVRDSAPAPPTPVRGTAREPRGPHE